MKYYDLHLGIDLGTGSLKLVAYGRAMSFTAHRGYEILSPAPGIAETAPDAWIRALKSAWEDVRSQIDRSCPSAKIRSIGLSGQMHGFVPLAMDGTPACNAILWADTRNAPYAEQYRAMLQGSFDRLLNALLRAFTALILLWLKMKHLKFTIARE